MAYNRLYNFDSGVEYDTLLEDKKNGLVVVDFHAAWCG